MAQTNTADYLCAEHAPVQNEIDADDLTVLGELPREMNGVFLRNSPNPRWPPVGRYHWFDGDGMVHGVYLEGGRACYRNRYIRTAGWQKEEQAGRALWSGIMEPPAVKPPQPPLKDTANTDLVWHQGRLLALWWLSGKPYELDRNTLQTLGVCAFGGSYGGTSSAGASSSCTMASHPKIDPNSGEMVFFHYNVVRAPYLHVGVVSAGGRVVHHTPIALPRPHILHDIAITPTHTILLDMPLGWASRGAGRRISFARDVPARFGVMPRFGVDADVRWFEAEPCYVFHTIAALHEGDAVVLTACKVADPLPAVPTGASTVPRLDAVELAPRLHRWRLDLATGLVREEALDDRGAEFPRVNPARLTNGVRYCYCGLLAPRRTVMFEGVVKYDLAHGGAQVHRFAPGWFGGESVFVPRPQGVDEDDGWVVTAISHVEYDRCELVILDAKNLAAPSPLARVVLPQRIPIGFHATWLPASA